MLRSYFISQGHFTSRVTSVWTPSILTDLIYGSFIRILPFDPIVTVRIVTSLITIAAVLMLVYVTYKYIDRLTALLFGVLLSLNPFFSFVSTEPEKGPMVVFFFSLSLLFLFFYRYREKSRNRNLALSFVFLISMMLAYRTGLFFAFCIVLAYALFTWDLKYRGRARKILASKFLYVILVVPVFIQIALPRITRRLNGASVYPAAESLATETSNQFAKFFNNILFFMENPEYLGATKFMEAAKNFIGPTVFGLGLLGLIIYFFRHAEKGEKVRAAPFVIWTVVVSAGFGLSYWSYSHSSRYPYYVIPAFLFMTAYLLRWLIGKITIAGAARKTAFMLILILLAAVLQLRLLQPPYYESFRLRYYTHELLADDLLHNVRIEHGQGIILQKWSSIMYYLVKDDIEREDDIFPVGWKSVDISVFTPEFLKENNIRYFVFDKVGDDYWSTPENLLTLLGNHQEIMLVRVSEVNNRKYFVRVHYMDY